MSIKVKHSKTAINQRILNRPFKGMNNDLILTLDCAMTRKDVTLLTFLSKLMCLGASNTGKKKIKIDGF